MATETHKQRAERGLQGIRKAMAAMAGTEDASKVEETMTPEGVEAAIASAPFIQALAQTAQVEATLHLADVIEEQGRQTRALMP